MVEEKDTTKEKKDKTNKGKSAKDWKEDEVSMLNELLEKRPKSEQSTGKLYVSNWVHYQSLAFFQPVMKSSSSKNILKQSNKDLAEIECTEAKAYSGSKKKSSAEKKIELFKKCTSAIANSTLFESQGIKRFAFATYVEEKLSGLNKRQITIAEKKINDVLFELEMSVGNEYIDRNTQPFQIQYSNFQNPPINQNPYPMLNIPYSTAGGSSKSTYTMEDVPTRRNTESYMDFLNSSK